MNAWLVRGIGMALVNVVVRVLLGAAVSHYPLQGSALRYVGVIIAILAAVVWGGIDGIRDRRRHADPDDSADLTILWLKAAVVGGILAGALSWIAGLITSFGIGDNSLFFELTSGAAFTILLIFVPATIAVTIGRFLAGRDAKKNGTDRDSDSRGRRDRNLVAAGASGSGSAALAHDSNTEYDSNQYGGNQYGGNEHRNADYADSEYENADYSDDAPTEVFEPVHQHDPASEHDAASEHEYTETPTAGNEQWREPGSHRSE